MASIKNIVGLAAATAAGAYIGSKYTEAKLSQKEEDPSYQYQYAPAYVQGKMIQDWERLKAKYMTKYGSRILKAAEDRVFTLNRTLNSMKKQGGYTDMFDLMLPFDHEAMEASLLKSGLRIHETGKRLNLFAYVCRDRFEPDGPLGANYELKRAMRGSIFLPASAVVKFDPLRKNGTLDYIGRGDTLIQNCIADILSDCQTMGLRCHFEPRDMETEKFYTLGTIVFDDEIAALV